MRRTIIFALVIITFLAAVVYADTLPDTLEAGAPVPVQWDTKTDVQNFTYYNISSQTLNWTRGFIYELVLQASQPTHRWIGYVGNITGNISLMDNSRNRLYAWDLNISSGEIYATRFQGPSAGTDPNIGLDNGSQRMAGVTGDTDYDYVDWTNVGCAAREYIENESIRLGHNDTVDNDCMNTTFKPVNANFMDFEVADRYIDVSSDGGVQCGGIMLYSSNAKSTDKWQEVVLEDGTTDGIGGDLIYAAIVEDDQTGFNGATFDFQILLPQYGQVLKGTTDDIIKDNIAYYFYLELIGERWPSS